MNATNGRVNSIHQMTLCRQKNEQRMTINFVPKIFLRHMQSIPNLLLKYESC